MNKPVSAEDPKGLIYEAYRIEGITKADCRTIFLDWALSLPAEQNSNAAIVALLDRYANAHAQHPMTLVMQEGQAAADTPRRRGGWRARAGRDGS